MSPTCRGEASGRHSKSMRRASVIVSPAPRRARKYWCCRRRRVPTRSAESSSVDRPAQRHADSPTRSSDDVARPLSTAATGLRCERLIEPIGIGTATPRLSWRLEATDGETDVVQLGWQIEVEGAWDSGRSDGRDQSVRYGGPPLGSRARHNWRV